MRFLGLLRSIVRILYEKKRFTLLLALAVIVLIPLLVVAPTLYSASKAPDPWISFIQTTQSLATTLVILIGGIWAFYVFVLGRSYSASVRIRLKSKQTIGRVNDEGDKIDECVVVSMNIKNVGRTRVDKSQCVLSVEPIGKGELLYQPELKPITNTIEKSPSVYSIFKPTKGLEPGAETEADVLIPMGEHPTVKVAVTFIGYVGPTLVPSKWRRANAQDWCKEIANKVDKWRQEDWVTRTIVDTRTHVTDIEMVD